MLPEQSFFVSLVDSFRHTGNAVHDVIVFFNEQNDRRLWNLLEVVAITLDHDGLTWNLIMGVLVEVINFFAFLTYYVFELSRPKVTEWLGSFD